MISARSVSRLVSKTFVAVLAFCLVALLAVQVEQYLLHWRVQRLMADMHGIHLYQTSWSDVQELMHRWGTWGSYTGTCSAKDCKYNIILTNIDYRPDSLQGWLVYHNAWTIMPFIGTRGVKVLASFTVHDGTIWRESMGVMVGNTRLGH